MYRIRNTNIKRIRFKPHPNQAISSKPIGLWYGIGKSWHKWCKSEKVDWIKLYDHEIHINKDTVLILNTVKSIKEFSKEYEGSISDPWKSLRGHSINWQKVSGRYHGIEINPYQWDLRMELSTSWYYTWDLASGCIWHRDGIKRIRRKQ